MSAETDFAHDPAASDDSTENARDGARKRRDPDQPSAVVGLGASAGGVGVLQQFFADMSPESGLAFVVVMHLSPDHESNLANILQQQTAMPVLQVTAAVKVKPNHIYVIPPNHQLAFNDDDVLELRERPHSTGRPVTIDIFFRTLARSFGQRCVGVILSGTDSDGVIGLKHIRAQGGVTVAQDPEEAEYENMPLTAISSGLVDWVLPVAEMPEKLMHFVRNENAMQVPPEIPEATEPDAKVENAPGGETISEETESPDDERAILDVLAHVRAQTGHDFTHYKRATILRRIARRLQVNLIESIPEYFDFIRRHPAEARALLQDLLIGVTHFFRDQESFAALAENIPQLFIGKAKEEQVRVWVAGCATGEEAYSIAMLLCEYAERLDAPPAILVFATDIDEHALLEARAGSYPLTIEADVSQERLHGFFNKERGRYRVRKTLREKVLFASHNFLSDAPFSRIDLLSCRNLLIYLGAKAQEKAFDVFHFALRPNGLLFVGGSDSGAVQSLFLPLDPKHRIYVRRSLPRLSWKLALLPLHAPEALPKTSRRPKRGLPALTQPAVRDGSTQSEAAVVSGHERRAAVFGELHLRLLEEYAPPSIVVNQEHEIVHLSGKAGRYLRFTAGEPSANIFTLIRPELQIELRTAIFSASQNEQHNVSTTPQLVQFDSRDEVVSVHVRRVESGQGELFFLLLFQQQDAAVVAPNNPTVGADMARGLHDQIANLKRQLANSVEQYEATNEELKASNEELQALNEEMRSGTEELETSKEELQSINEELSTVNAELKSSVEDLSRANADLNNLMASTDIGTIFLTRQLHVHRFTPSAQKVFNLLPTDVGRPLADLTHHLDYDGFISDVQKVVDRLATIEREVACDSREAMGGERRWYLVRIAPYRTQPDRIAGVVVTLIDISRRRRAEEELRTGEERYRTLFNLVPVAVYSTDAEGIIQEFNHRAVELWGRKPGAREKFCGSFRIFHPDGTPMPHEECPMARVLRGEEIASEELEIVIEQESGARRNVVVGPRARRDEHGNIVGAINCLHDITARKSMEEALRASEERLRTIADNVPQLIWTNTGDGTPNYFNGRWYAYTGLNYEQSIGPGWQTVVHPEDASAAAERWHRALAAGEVFDSEYRLRRADGQYRWFIGRNVPLRYNGEVLGWFGSATDIHKLKEAEAAQRESEERYRLMVDGARDYAIFLLSPSNDIVYWSAGAERVFGWSADEAVGQSGELIFTPEDRATEQEEKEIEIALREGCASDRRWHMRKDGTRIWVDGVMRRLNDEQTGALRGFAKIARNATEQREAEELLRQAHEELERRVKDRTAELLATNTELHEEMRRRQTLEREILGVTERERARVGQDLHDGLCQELTATAFLLKSRAKELARKVPDCATALEDAAKIVNKNAGRARDLARGLHPSELGAGGLQVALRELATRANERVPCRCECPSSVRINDENIALNLYRVAQEAVTNALKHARASEIVIAVRRDDSEVVLSVTDHGLGMRAQARKKRTMGIHMMKYRADVCGGKLQIESQRGHGTTVTCRVPLKS